MESGMFEDEFQNDGSFLHDEFEDGENFEDTENETSDATDDPKRQDLNGEVTERRMWAKQVPKLPVTEQIIVPFKGNQPVGTDIDGLLGQYLGRLASNHKLLPISFKKWPEVVKTYKDWVWEKHIKVKFWWEPIHEAAARTSFMMDMGKKWRENRIRLFHTKFDKTLSREENIRNPPLSIPPTEWAAFIDYRLEEDTMKKSKQNAANRAKLTITIPVALRN
ncbi:uncharacterized protein LOC130717546 [Lotus japonicus]|uniref:uncharacterized protein LOC130717546 n=1 Tax=Lotus japonicus TaxID=34305 RepID=UPI0025863231|nr:uncharacterized protein LOC130717546 [Lotus japonicus]